MLINLVNCRFFVTSDYYLQKTIPIHTFLFLCTRFHKAEITSRRILYYVTTYLLLRRDVANTASGRIFHCIRTQLLLRLDVSFTASERIFLPFFTSKIAKNDRKSIVLNRKSSVFAQYLLSFRPKIPLKHLYFADFMPKVVICGNKVTIKTPLITTRYSLIVKGLRRAWQM